RVTEGPRDIATLIDAAAECRGGSRHIDRGNDAGSQRKRVRAGGVPVLARYATPVVDSAGPGVGGSRNVDGDEDPFGGAQVTVNSLQDIESDDLADVVDAKRESLCCRRHIDLGEHAVLVQKSVIDSGVIDDVSHHVTLVVDSENSCERNTGK